MKNNDVDLIIHSLGQTPLLLPNLVKDIPEGQLKIQRKKGKWSIHEHVCHLAQAESMILGRFEDFKRLDAPEFFPYLPGKTVSADNLLHLDLQEEMDRFKDLRKSLLALVTSFDDSIWNKKAVHQEYREYNAYILLRHVLLHDHFHMYRIEELWLTKEEYL